jgi:hypothetical protein
VQPILVAMNMMAAIRIRTDFAGPEPFGPHAHEALGSTEAIFFWPDPFTGKRTPGVPQAVRIGRACARAVVPA